MIHSRCVKILGTAFAIGCKIDGKKPMDLLAVRELALPAVDICLGVTYQTLSRETCEKSKEFCKAVYFVKTGPRRFSVSGFQCFVGSVLEIVFVFAGELVFVFF